MMGHKQAMRQTGRVGVVVVGVQLALPDFCPVLVSSPFTTIL